jgi:serine/threonine protein kinase
MGSNTRYLELVSPTVFNVLRMVSLGENGSLKLHMRQCRFLAFKLFDLVQDSKAYVEGLGDDDAAEWEPALDREIYRVAKVVEYLVQDCCPEDWLKAVIKLRDIKEAFALRVREIEWCRALMRALVCLRKEPTQGVTAVVKRAIDECVKSRESYCNELKVLAGRDERELCVRLEAMENEIGGTPDYRTLAKCMLGRMNGEKVAAGDDGARDSWTVPFEDLQRGKLLGKGAFGEVHKTLWLGQWWAEKKFGAHLAKAFGQEMELLKNLSHPNIVLIVCCAEDNREFSFVMELMTGDLRTLIESSLTLTTEIANDTSSSREVYYSNATDTMPLGLDVAIDIMIQLAAGMMYLHERKVAHRDLKSHNILVQPLFPQEPNGYQCAKVADFGLAKIREESTCSNLSTVGTTRWMAPELYDGRNDNKQPVDVKPAKYDPFKPDVYSFAMTCYEILTGRLPFEGAYQGQVRTMVKEGIRPELPENCPSKLKTLITECWHGDPEQRPAFPVIYTNLRCIQGERLIGNSLILDVTSVWRHWLISWAFRRLLSLTDRGMANVDRFSEEPDLRFLRRVHCH